MAWSFALPGDFLYVLIFSLVADKFIPVFCREIIFMVFDESFQVGLTAIQVNAGPPEAYPFPNRYEIMTSNVR